MGIESWWEIPKLFRNKPAGFCRGDAEMFFKYTTKVERIVIVQVGGDL